MAWLGRQTLGDLDWETTVKHALLACLLLISVPALATPEDDHINHVACLVGGAASTLVKQRGPKDTEAALMAAAAMCPDPAVSIYGDDFEYGEMLYPVIEESPRSSRGFEQLAQTADACTRRRRRMKFSSGVFPGLLAPARATARELAKSDLQFREVEGKSGLFVCREGNV